MIRKIALLGLTALAAVTANGPSFAVALPVTQVIWVSGSTALDNAFKNFMLIPGATPCTAGTIDTYENNNKNNPYAKSNQYTVIACTITSALGTFAAGSNVAFVKESNGGSVEGTTPVSNGTTTLSFLDPTQSGGLAGCTTVSPGVPYPGGHDGAFTDHTGCTGPVSSHVPDVGLADENPEVFTIGPNAASNAIVANLTTKPMFANMFGVGVSLNLYRALQVQQGLSGTTACPANSDLLSCMPSLTRQQVRTLIAAGINSAGWGAIINGSGTAITDKSFNGGVNNVSNTVYVCRRGDTSGTQAAGDIYFLNNRCQVNDNEHPNNPAGNAFVAATTTAANCGGLPSTETPEDFGCTWAAVNVSDTVFPGTGTGDVAKCLAAHDSNPATSTTATFAIGVIATNNTFAGPAGSGAGTGDYRLVALNGGHPTVQALANGTYDFAMLNVANVAKTGSTQAAAFHTLLTTKLTTPGVLGDIIVAQPTDANFGVGGLFDNFTSGAPLPSPPLGLAATKTSPTSDLTQLASGTTQNDCLPPIPGSPAVTVQAAEDAP